MSKYTVSRRFKVPSHNVKTIMGIRGATIQSIMEEFNVRLIFDGENTADYPDGRVLQIRAFNEKDAEEARKKVQELIFEANSRPPPITPSSNLTNNRRMHSSLDSVMNVNQNHNNYVEDEFLVPMAYYIQVAGRSEGNLKSLKASTDLSALEVGGAKMTQDGQQVRTIYLRGSAEKVAEAKVVLQGLLDSFKDMQPKEVSWAPTEATWGVDENNWKPSKPKVPDFEVKHFKQAIHQTVDNSNQMATIHSTKSGPVFKNANRSISFKEDTLGHKSKTNKSEGGSLRAKVSSIIKLVAELAEEIDEQQDSESEIINLKRELKLADESMEGMLVENLKLKGELDEERIEKAQQKQKFEAERQRMLESVNQASAPSCIDCMRSPRDTVLFPCLHITSCRRCSEQLNDCPVCKRGISSKLAIKILETK